MIYFLAFRVRPYKGEFMIFQNHSLRQTAQDALLCSADGRAEEMGLLLPRLQAIANRIWNSPRYALCLLVAATLLYVMGCALEGCLIMALVVAFMLLFCAELMAVLLPFLLFCLLTTDFYNDLGRLLVYWPVLAGAVAAFVIHLFLYRVPLRRGTFTAPLLAVSAATLLGGLGAITAADYFSPVSLYYTLGLGLGMLGVYTVVRAQLSRARGYDVLQRFLNLLYYAGLFAGVAVFKVYIVNVRAFLQDFAVLYMSYRNFCTTILLMAMPAACMPRADGRWRWGGLIFLYSAMIMSGSRSGLIFGTVELAACLGWLYHKAEPELKPNLYRLGQLAAVPVVLFVYYTVQVLFSSRVAQELHGAFIPVNDSRFTFFMQGLRDFASNPLFGIGLGNLSNEHIFIGVHGSIVWYHNMVAQILGSMGLVGVAAYGWHYLIRLKILLTRRSAQLPLAALSCAGMVLMSMTNPGEFCPLPNGLLMVALFAILETLPRRERPLGSLRRRKRGKVH